MYCESLFTSSIDFPAKNVYRNVYIYILKKKKKDLKGFYQRMQNIHPGENIQMDLNVSGFFASRNIHLTNFS